MGEAGQNRQGLWYSWRPILKPPVWMVKNDWMIVDVLLYSPYELAQDVDQAFLFQALQLGSYKADLKHDFDRGWFSQAWISLLLDLDLTDFKSHQLTWYVFCFCQLFLYFDLFWVLVSRFKLSTEVFAFGRVGKETRRTSLWTTRFCQPGRDFGPRFLRWLEQVC